MIGKEVMTEAKTRTGETVAISNSTMYYVEQLFSQTIVDMNNAKNAIRDYYLNLTGAESLDEIWSKCMRLPEVVTYVEGSEQGTAARRSRLWIMRVSISSGIRSYIDKRVDEHV